MALGLLISTAVGTILSRNAAFPILLVATAFLIGAAWARDPCFLGSLRSVVWTWSKRRSPLFFFGFLSSAFAALSLVWSPIPSRGLGAFAQTNLAVIAATVCCLIILRYRFWPRWLPEAMLAATGFASVLLCIELFLGSPLRGVVGASTEVYRLNRAAIVLALFAPLLFLIKACPKVQILRAALIIASVFAINASESESALIAVIVAITTLALSQFVPIRIVAWLCAFGILATHIFAPIVALIVHRVFPPDTIVILGDTSVQVRAQIWFAYAQAALQQPLLGHGIGASFLAGQTYTGVDPKLAFGLGFIHPHNVSLQIWYELGVTGIGLSSILLGLIFQQILKLSGQVLVVLLALLSAVWTVAYISHGAWQHWWWALVGINVILFSALSKRDPDSIAKRRYDG